MQSAPSARSANVSNLLTLARLLVTPLFIILLLRDQMMPALMVFTLAGISDGLDGLIARWFNQQTTLGAYLDPVADKVLLVSAFVCLSVLEILPDWLAVVVLSRDLVIVIGIAIFTLTKKPFKIRPSLVSKCTTAAQIVVVIAALLVQRIPGLELTQRVLLWTTAALTMISGFHYVYVGLVILQQGEEAG